MALQTNESVLAGVDDGEGGPALFRDAATELIELFIGVDHDRAGAEANLERGLIGAAAASRVDGEPAVV
jgi:hypothetical protein